MLNVTSMSLGVSPNSSLAAAASSSLERLFSWWEKAILAPRGVTLAKDRKELAKRIDSVNASELMRVSEG